MSLKELVYSVLIVSASEKFNDAISPLLSGPNYRPVQTVSSIHAARRTFSERAFDFVIINSPLPDDVGTRFAIDTCHFEGSIVLFVVRTDLYDDIFDKVAEHGVFTLPKPTSKPMLATALNWMSSARERLRISERKTLSIEEKMKEIRIVNRAKWLLISNAKMDEAAAHHHIEKLAMDRCVTKREAAEDIIRTYQSNAPLQATGH